MEPGHSAEMGASGGGLRRFAAPGPPPARGLRAARPSDFGRSGVMILIKSRSAASAIVMV